MTSSIDSIEVTAATVDAAINEALQQLGADQDDVAIEVLSTPRAGVLGLGARQARVRITRRSPDAASSGVMSPPPAPPPRPRAPEAVRSAPPARPVAPPKLSPAPTPPPARLPEPPMERPMRMEEAAELEALTEEVEDERRSADFKGQVAESRDLLRQILALMGEEATIEVVNDSDVEMLELNVKGDGSGLLIGRHGQTLDALEYIINRVIARRIKDAAPISIDTESYRARRRGQLHRMALGKGEEAKREHKAVTLEPMPPRDRRIIHLALKDDPLITTRSAGEGFLRAIQIVPVDERRDSGGNRGGRDRQRERGNGGESDQPLGQQGGFRHGQKRIV